MIGVESVLKAIAEPHRMEIVRLVWDQELAASALASRFSLTRQAVSRHVGVLVECGLLEERRDGARRLYRVRQERIAELREFLEDYWAGGLERIKLDVEATDALDE